MRVKNTVALILSIGSAFQIVAQSLIPFRSDGFYGYKDSLTGIEKIKPKYKTAEKFHEGLAVISVDNNKYGYIDKKGREVVTPKYNTARKFARGMAGIELNDKWGFIDQTGKEIVPPRYDYLNDFTSLDLAYVKFEDKWGLINKSGKEIISPRFDHLTILTKNLIAAVVGGGEHYESREYNGGKWGFYNHKGEEITPLKFDGAKYLSDDLVAVNIGCEASGETNLFCSGGKWGAIDRNGKLVTEVKYDDFHYTQVHLNDKVGLIDGRTGKELLPPVYEGIHYGTVNELFAVKTAGKWGFVDSLNKVAVNSRFQDAKRFYKGLAAVKLNEKWGFIDHSGKEIISFAYDEIAYDDGMFENGYAVLKKDSKWGVIDRSGKEMIGFKYDFLSKNGNFFEVKIGEKRGVVDKTGKEIIPVQYDVLFIMEDYITVNKGGRFSHLANTIVEGKSGLYNISGKQIVPCKYDRIENFSEGFAAVELDGRWGFINRNGKEITPLKYDRVKDFKNGKAAVDFRGESGTVDKSGREIGVDYNKLVKISVDYNVGLVNLKGDTIAQPVYEYIYEDACFLRAGIDSKMTIINKYVTKQKPLKYDTYGFSVLENGITASVKVDEKIGFVDSLGEEIIPPVYSDFKDFSVDGLIAVASGDKYSKDKKWGLFDLNGREILPVTYQRIDGAFNKNEKQKTLTAKLLLVSSNGMYGFIDLNGKIVIPLKYARAELFDQGLTLVAKSAGKDQSAYKYGFLNEKGKDVIPLKYDEARGFNEKGLIQVALMLNDTLKYGFIDRAGREIIPIKYESVDFEIKGGLISVKRNGKYGFVDLNGNEVVPPKYDYANSFKRGFAEVEYYSESGDLSGVIDSTGKSVIPVIYRSVSDLDEKGIFLVEDTAGKYAQMNSSGDLITKFYDQINASYFKAQKQELKRIVEKSKTGLIDSSGKEVIPPVYDDLREISRDKFAVKKNNLFGVIDINNKEIVPLRFSNPVNFHTQHAVAFQNVGGRSNGFSDIIGGKWGIIDSTGNTVVPFDFEAMGDVCGVDFIPVKKNGKWGYIDLTGNMLIKPAFELAGCFGEVSDDFNQFLPESDNFAPVVVSGKYAAIDRSGKVIAPDFSGIALPSGLLGVSILYETGFIDNRGRVVLPFRYGETNAFDSDSTAWSSEFGETNINTRGEFVGFRDVNAKAGENDKYGLVDKFGNVLVDARFDDVTVIGNKGLAIVQLKGKYGVIDTTGNEVVAIKFNHIDSEDGSDTLKVQLDGKYGLIHATGQELTPVKYDEIDDSYGEYKMKVRLNDKYGYINRAGKELIPIKYDQIDHVAEGKYEVMLNGKSLYIDEDGKEVQEE